MPLSLTIVCVFDSVLKTASVCSCSVSDRPTANLGLFGSEHPDRGNPPLCPGFLLHRKGRRKRLNPQTDPFLFCLRVLSHRLIYGTLFRCARHVRPCPESPLPSTSKPTRNSLYLSPASQQPRATPDHRPVPPPIGLPRTRPARSFSLGRRRRLTRHRPIQCRPNRRRRGEGRRRDEGRWSEGRRGEGRRGEGRRGEGQQCRARRAVRDCYGIEAVAVEVGHRLRITHICIYACSMCTCMCMRMRFLATTPMHVLRGACGPVA